MKYQSIVLLLILGCNSETNQAVGTLQEEFADNETDIAHLVEELEQLRGELEILQTEVETLKTDNAVQLENLQSLTEALAQRPTTEELSVWMSENRYATSEDVMQMISDTSPSTEEFSNLQTQVTDQDALINANLSSLTQLQTDVLANTVNIASNTSDNTTNATTIAINTAAATQNTADLSSALSNVSANSNAISTNSTGLQALRVDVDALEILIQDNTDAVDDLSVEIDEVDQNVSALSGGVEVGAIVLWSGAIADIPSGWALCDGNNGTPDLQDQFIIGAGSTYAIGDNGGDNGSSISYSTSALYQNYCNTFYGCPPLLNVVTSLSGISNLPPYYALAYIMKL